MLMQLALSSPLTQQDVSKQVQLNFRPQLLRFACDFEGPAPPPTQVTLQEAATLFFSTKITAMVFTSPNNWCHHCTGMPAMH